MTYRTPDQVAAEFIAEGKRRDITARGIIICIATGLVESNLTVYANPKVPESLSLPHDAVGHDGHSVGPLQQQVIRGNGGRWWWSNAATCMDPTTSAGLFYDRLTGLDYNGPNSPGSYAQAVQQSAYPHRYDQRMDEARAIYARLTKPGGNMPENIPAPVFNEFAHWSPNRHNRGGTRPSAWLIHTQEGGGGDAAAENLANYLANPANQVSYHYTISQAVDGGVTVVDCVDTDDASWSVGDANDISINLCFAGSRASWTRAQWLTQINAIDVAAWLAVQDCDKYGITPLVVPPPYSAGTPGISDHKWVTDVYGWGTHTDVGPNFPWDVFAAAVAKYAGQTQQAPEVPVETLTPAEQHELLTKTREIWDQLRIEWPQLNRRTLVDAASEIGLHLGIPGYSPPARKDPA